MKVERRKQKNRDSAAKSRMNQKKKEKVLEKVCFVPYSCVDQPPRNVNQEMETIT